MAEQRHLMTPGDVALACALLSRLPIPVDPDFAASRGARAAWAYPLAGLLVAAIAGGLGWIGLQAGLPLPVVAGLVLAAQVVLTGAMHEDGLADSADGLWGGWTRERRLEIMKDSRIGTYGVLALALALGLRWSALGAMDVEAFWAALLAAALLSRAAMTALMAALGNARDGGLSRSVGRPGRATAGLAVGLAFLLCLPLAGWATLALAAAAALAALAWGAIARAKIGGQTGDILGAGQQISEIAVLALATITIG